MLKGNAIIAQSGGLAEGPALQAGLAVLASMELIDLDPNEARLALCPGKKRSPEDNALFRRLRRIADYAAEKE